MARPSCFSVSAMRLFVFAIILLFFKPISTGAESHKRTFTIYFRFDSADIDRNYMSNAKQIDSLINYLCTHPSIDSLAIVAASSPEGNVFYNRALAERRAASAKKFINDLIARGVIPPIYQLSTKAIGENWDGLEKELDENYFGENRIEVLDITRSDLSEEEKKNAIKALDGGQTYAYILRNHMKTLRYTSGIITYCRTMPNALGISDVVLETPIWPRLPEQIPLLGVSDSHRQEKTPTPRRTIMAVKTNLLFDAATVVNWAVEVPLGNRFSVQIQEHTPWWLSRDNRKCLQLLTLGPELRWWFVRQSSRRYGKDYLTGHFVGAYAFSGKGDLQWDNTGRYQFDGWSVGLSYGWSKRISRLFNLELSLAAGYTNFKWVEYNPSADWLELFFAKEGRKQYIGPTKAEISLVMPIRVKSKKHY